MRSALTGLTALTDLARTREATYATTFRPLMQGMGGGGYLQYVEMINQLITPNPGTPLFGAELKVTRKINAQNYLRAAGRASGVEVKTGRGMQSISVPSSPHVIQMVLSAYVNDAAGFRQAYSEAVAAAREDGKDDPEGYIRRAYESRSPLGVFRVKPTESELAKVFAQMPADGRRDVGEAIRFYNHYANEIGATEAAARVEKPIRMQSMADIRRATFRSLGVSVLR